MRIGDLNRRLTIQTKTMAKNSAQQLVETWSAAFTRWANLKALTGGERWLQGQQVAGEDTMITVRFDSQTRKMKPESHRMVDEDSVIFDIKAAFDADGRRRWWTLLATRRVS